MIDHRDINEKFIQEAAQAWCHPDTSHLEMQPELALVFAKMLEEAYNERKES